MSPEPHSEEVLRQKLEASETRYRQLFESAREGILIFDATTGLITAANPYLEELLGYSPEKLPGKRIFKDDYRRYGYQAPRPGQGP